MSLSASPWYIGIDPGTKGGIGLYEPTTGKGEAWRYPGDEYGVHGLLREILASRQIRLAILERVASRPDNGVKAAFTFGSNVGSWRMALICHGIRFLEITPQEWMRGSFDARANSKTLDTKVRSLDLARRLFPDVDLQYKADDGKAEALLMARYAASLPQQ